MPFKSVKCIAICIGLFAFSTNCKNDTKQETTPEVVSIDIYNFDDQSQLATYSALDLDATHPNMLNPSNSGEDNEIILQSWTELHQDVASFLSEKNFSWNVPDERITILHKIYFNPDGSIKSYFFRTITNGISKETKDQYANLFSEFANSHTIDYSSSMPFAQCGKSVYPN